MWQDKPCRVANRPTYRVALLPIAVLRPATHQDSHLIAGYHHYQVLE